MNVPTGLAWNSVESQSNDGEIVSSLMLSRQVTLKIGTRRSSTVKTLLRLMRTLCPAFAPYVWSQITPCQTNYLKLNVNHLLPPSTKSKLFWGTA